MCRVCGVGDVGMGACIRLLESDDLNLKFNGKVFWVLIISDVLVAW